MVNHRSSVRCDVDDLVLHLRPTSQSFFVLQTATHIIQLRKDVIANVVMFLLQRARRVLSQVQMS